MRFSFRTGRSRAAFWLPVLLVLLIPAFRLAVAPLRAQGPPPQAAVVQIEGELEVEIEDSTAGARVHHFVRVPSGRVRLQLGGQAPGWQSGSRVRARGRLSNGTLALDGGGSLQALALASPNTFGVQRVAVILVNWNNNFSAPYSSSTAQNVTFDQVNRYYQENSYGQTSLSGQVFGWFTLPIAPTTCDYYLIANEADKVAAAHGVNLSQFTRKVYAFPKFSPCSWWGLGTVGGNPSRAWVNGSYALKVVGHELGHNFGDYHSNSLPCSSSGCSVSEYGDDRDMMGGSASGHFTAFQKERLGWLNYGVSPPIQTVTTGGTYWIEGYGTPSNGGPKALRILKSTDSSGRRTWYYVESRARQGFDAGFAAGVTIHTGSEATGNSSYQVDLAPSTTTFDSLLDPGQVFADASLDLAIRTVSASDAGAFVEISYPGVPCTTAAPTMTLSPAAATASAGTPVSLSVTLRNNDNASGCSATTFSLGRTVPTGWSATFVQTSLTIAPGASASTTLTVTPTAGSGSVTASAARVNTAGPGGSASATVNAVSSLAVGLSIVKTNAYVISATVKAGSSVVSGARVTFALRSPAGKLSSYSATTNGSGLAKVTVRLKAKDPRGTYSVTATATSGALSGTASGTFTF
jgi:hypothetical protein